MSTVDETSAAETDAPTAEELTAVTDPATPDTSADAVAPEDVADEAKITTSDDAKVDVVEGSVAETSYETDVPNEVLAMDGVKSEDEAHNAERPARKSLKKKPKGLPLTDFKVGDTIKAKAKSVAAYGAFMDIGAETDGLLHISNLSTDFVSSVKDVIEVGQEYDVRILTIDLTKKQVALSLLTEEQESEAAANAARPSKREQQQRPQGGDNKSGGGGGNNSNRRDDGVVVQQLQEKGWDKSQFVSGTVVSTVDFGAFVRVDASQFNAEVTGELDGLVHISALAAGRVKSVGDVVKIGDSVQVRCTSIEQRKVSLTMVSEADAALAAEARGGGGDSSQEVVQGNKDWKNDMEKLQEAMPVFSNRPVIVNSRKD
jgi:predicted RNA-binding protein with RPS1 domain